MNENVIEIVSYLVKQIMHNEDIIENEEQLVENLVSQGYEIADIDTAFELIFSSDVYNEENGAEDSNDEFKFKKSQRILDIRERFKLSVSAQGVLLRLSSLGLISDDELEELLEKSVHIKKRELGLKSLWKILSKVIDDPTRLSVIIENSPEFESINSEHKQYIN
ncbi:DUF494 family protein [Sporohalobacter salinus]|uniref:DUF494 family protein n=1 Tax=Sporohalobacter salinus TaxID=1494606 RepID=UPI0019607E64|nr:DUF494 family protein [Sporohalobacter salinus]MBM7623533.1 Smg protein [Sporohalobacter salinus]